MVKKYWAVYTDEIDGFNSGDMVVGTAWPVNLQYTEAAGKVPVEVGHPVRGRHRLGRHVDDVQQRAAPELHAQVDGVHAAARRPDAGRGVLRSHAVQHGVVRPAEQRTSAPTPPRYHCGDDAFLSQVKLWKTPLSDCGDDRGQTCTDYSAWTNAWTEIRGAG